MNEEVDELAAAAAASRLCRFSRDGDGDVVVMSGPHNVSVESGEVPSCFSEAIAVDKENEGGQRRSSKVRSRVTEATFLENPLLS